MRRYGVSGLPRKLSKRALGDKNAAVLLVGLVLNAGLMGGRPVARPLVVLLLSTTEDDAGLSGDFFAGGGGRFQPSALDDEDARFTRFTL
jgi:hypothetical protein